MKSIIILNKYETEHHRIDGPAIEWSDGSYVWKTNDLYHRVGGPAISYSHGTKEWWVNGKRHREDGPAYENKNRGIARWYINDELLTCQTQEEFEQYIRLKSFW